MLTGAVRARLAADQSLGAGSFFHHVRDVRPGDEEVLWCDPDFRCPDGHTETVLTLNHLANVVETYAGWYQANGVRPRDPVVVSSGSALGCVVNFLALTGLGAIPALVNGNLPAAVAAEYVGRLGAVGSFADAAHADVLRGAVAPDGIRFVATYDDVRPGDRASLPPGYPYQHHALDPVLITHSSGTTGDPKAVCVNHAGFFAATRYRLTQPLPQGYERVLSALPPSHNSGVTMVMLSLLTGMPARIMSTQDADAVLAAIEAFRPTMVAAFAGTYADLADRDLSRHDLSSVTVWYNSGDTAHRAHIRAIIQAGSHVENTGEGRRVVPGSIFHDGLGSSEMGHSLFRSIHRPGEEKPRRCIGKPYEFVEAVVLADDGATLPSHRIGRLGVKSPTITPGYWNDSVATYRARLRGYWLTGDLVYQDDDGYFYHVDRVTDAISVPGRQLFSVWAEELLLDSFPELEDCTVVGLDSGNDRHAEAHALLTMRPGSNSGGDWAGRINAVLADAGMPGIARAAIVADGDLPYGPTGKVKKRELRVRSQVPGGRGSVP